MVNASSGLDQGHLHAPRLRPLDYLDATTTTVQPFCGSHEGWGPFSPTRFDFTPCFLDLWVVVVSTFGVLFGGGAVWLLCTHRKPAPVAKDWHFYAKLVSIMPAIVYCLIPLELPDLMCRSHSQHSSLRQPLRLVFKLTTTPRFGLGISDSGLQSPPLQPFA